MAFGDPWLGSLGHGSCGGLYGRDSQQQAYNHQLSQQQYYGNGLGGTPLTYTLTGTTTLLGDQSVMAKTKQASGVIFTEDGAIVEVCDTVEEATRKARALSAKNTESYLVFKACKRISPKPVDLEETDL